MKFNSKKVAIPYYRNAILLLFIVISSHTRGSAVYLFHSFMNVQRYAVS